MKLPVAQSSSTGGVATAAIRSVAAAVRQCADEGEFAVRIREILRVVPLLQRSTVELGNPAALESAFATGVYTLPLAGSGGVHGVLRHPIDAGPLGVPELNSLHAAADLLGAIIDAAGRLRESRRIVALLQFLADQMPVGIVCLGPRPAVLACNRAAAAFLDGDPLRAPEAFWSGIAPAASGATARCLRRDDRMGIVDIRPAAGSDVAAAGGVVLIVDCTESARAFRDALARETYRCLCEKERLTLVVASSSAPEQLISAGEALRARLPARAAAGPVDSELYGFVFPALDRAAATMLLRGMERLRQVRNLHVGVASLHEALRSPEALLEAARARQVPWASASRPELFIFDRASTVTETLAFVLRGSCGVTCANRSEHAHALLAERPFDGMILELPAAADQPGGEFVRQAIALQPAARPFFVTSLPRPWSLREWGLPEGTVFRKPFAVQEVRAAVHAAFSGQEPKR